MQDLIIMAYSMVIRKDDEKMILLSFDLDENNETLEQTEGILNKVNSELSNTIQEYFHINLIDYGVEVLDDETTFVLEKKD